MKRHAQGWLHEMGSDLDNVIQRIRAAKSTKQVHRRLDLRKYFIDSLFRKFVAFGAVQYYVDLREKGHIISHARPSASGSKEGLQLTANMKAVFYTISNLFLFSNLMHNFFIL
jgi:hypothetical protein